MNRSIEEGPSANGKARSCSGHEQPRHHRTRPSAAFTLSSPTASGSFDNKFILTVSLHGRQCRPRWVAQRSAEQNLSLQIHDLTPHRQRFLAHRPNAPTTTIAQGAGVHPPHCHASLRIKTFRIPALPGSTATMAARARLWATNRTAMCSRCTHSPWMTFKRLAASPKPVLPRCIHLC